MRDLSDFIKMHVRVTHPCILLVIAISTNPLAGYNLREKVEYKFKNKNEWQQFVSQLVMYSVPVRVELFVVLFLLLVRTLL